MMFNAEPTVNFKNKFFIISDNGKAEVSQQEFIETIRADYLEEMLERIKQEIVNDLHRKMCVA